VERWFAHDPTHNSDSARPRLDCAGSRRTLNHQWLHHAAPPLGQGSGAVLLEDVAAVEMAVLVEVVVKRGMERVIVDSLS
jgi:hypothetical protein